MGRMNYQKSNYNQLLRPQKIIDNIIAFNVYGINEEIMLASFKTININLYKIKILQK